MDDKILYYPMFHDPARDGSERSNQVRRWVERFLIPAGRATWDEAVANTYLVATGDGGLMRAVHAKYSAGKTLVGLNCGRFGFLMNPINEISDIPERSSELKLIRLRLMRVEFFAKTGERETFLVFNDVVIGNDVADFIEYEISGSLSHFPNRKVSGTGLIISTPQGTTGYALKARGSSAVIPLDSDNWFIGGIATGPYPADHVSPQTILIESRSRNKIHGYADGRNQVARDIFKAVISPTDHFVTLGFLAGIDFPARRISLAQAAERGE